MLLTIDDVTTMSFNHLYLTLSVPAADLQDCSAFSGVICGTLADLTGPPANWPADDGEWFNSNNPTNAAAQGAFLLPLILPGGDVNSGDVFKLTGPSKSLLSALSVAILTEAHIGFDLSFNQTSTDLIPFNLTLTESETSPAPVPEPATGSLLALGIGWLAAQRRRRASSRGE